MLQSSKGTTADKQDIGCINIDKLLMRMLTSSLRRNAGNSTFKDFQQSLLNTFTGNITGNGNVFGFTGNFVNLVDIDNAALSSSMS